PGVAGPWNRRQIEIVLGGHLSHGRCGLAPEPFFGGFDSPVSDRRRLGLSCNGESFGFGRGGGQGGCWGGGGCGGPGGPRWRGGALGADGGVGAGAGGRGAAGAGRVAPAPASVSIRPTTVWTGTVSPSCTRISASTPAPGAGISASTLSVEISKMGSSRLTGSPAFLSHRESVPSAMDSPIWGMTTSIRAM